MENIEEVKGILTSMCEIAALSPVPELSALVTGTLLELHKPQYISKWCNMLNGVWEISASVNIALANILMDRKEIKVEQTLRAVTLLEELLRRNNEFLLNYKVHNIT